jgi:3-deoxy-D-manno-octulosonic-acid transferase
MLYNRTIFILNQVLKLVGRFNPKVKLQVAGQNSWKEGLNKRDHSKRLVWFHCASLGEFEQGRPIIERFKKKYPDWQIMVTFFSPSGYEVRKNYAAADIICYLPLDLPKNVSVFLDSYEPDIAIFVKYEFWRNYSFELKSRGIPLLSISTILRENQYFFKPWGNFGRGTLRQFTHFFVQNAETESLLKNIGISDVTLAGDTRFDSVADTLKSIRDIEIASNFNNNSKVLIGGSVWPEDMEVLIPYINQSENLKFIIAPHEIKDKQISEWESRLIGKSAIRYSKAVNNIDLSKSDVLIIDNIGLLSSLYQYGDFAFIGGGFATGLHNVLEAATFGMPIFFGDKAYSKFQEAKDLIEEGGAFKLSDFESFETRMKQLLSNGESYKAVKNITSKYVKNHTGATDVILNWIENAGIIKP